MTTQDKSSQTSMTPQNALELLRAGNSRFLAQRHAERNLLEQVKKTSKGQFPFAVVLSCIDSRVPAEIVFDQGIGDMFSARVAGNVINEDILGSMEFACQLAGSKLIVLLGHSSCGAVKGACAGAELGNLTGLLDRIRPAIESTGTPDDSSAPDYIQRVAEKNVELGLEDLQERSPVLKALIDEGKVGLIGAMYSVQTGAVEFGELICGS